MFAAMRALTSATMRALAPATACTLLFVPPCAATPPTLYSAAAYQSPVRGDPGDLLLVPGYGFAGGDAVVYEAISDTTKPLAPPRNVPVSSSGELGLAAVVSAADVPYSLTIRLPDVMKAGQSYALWVVDRAGEWSNGIEINDARPLWITPDEAYASAESAGLSRIMKVVGRNLQSASRAPTEVRLIGSKQSFRLSALIDATSGSAIDRYVAKIRLPKHMAIGSYSVELSRDGVSWVPLMDPIQGRRQTLHVSADPGALSTYPVGDYTFGTCNPDTGACPAVKARCLPDAGNGGDETLCVAAAIAAARAAGGGAVVFGPGTWVMNDAGTWASGRLYSSKGASQDGLLVPDGVSLEGAGSSATTLVRGAGWDIHLPSFALQGHNEVRGFRFRDAHPYTNGDAGTGLLMLGVRVDRAGAYHPVDPTRVSHVVITHDVFYGPYYAIANAGLAIDHLMVTHDEFGAFRTALSWEGYWWDAAYRYRYSDSVVAYNRFFPSSYSNPAIHQGAIATELSGDYRTDFSNNVADGTSTAYLYEPTDPKGWRAAYFWSLSDNVEMTLVSQNSASCTGDKDGDGEGIAFDDNHNRRGFAAPMVPVIAASSSPPPASGVGGASIISLKASLIDTQLMYGTRVNVGAVSDYYVGDWLQVVRGTGLGQARKILAVSPPRGDGIVTLTVAPAFDVLPRTDSLVADSRLYWQTYAIDNLIDHRRPPCLKSNSKRRAGGVITLSGATADSVVEGNTQYDTSGILLAAHFIESSNEIRGNTISGTYDISDATPQAQYGIAVAYGAAPDAPPPLMSYGTAISHNVLSGVGGAKGAISLNRTWFTGPDSQILHGVTPWKIAESTLIFDNTLGDIRPGASGVAIGLSAGVASAPVEWRTVLYGNRCNGTPGLGPGVPRLSKNVVDLGTETVRVCAEPRLQSCECGRSPTDLGVIGPSGIIAVGIGHPVTYSVFVVNNGPNVATNVALSAEPPAGVRIESMTGPGIACDTGDTNVNLCRLGNLDAGARVTVTVKVTAETAGTAETNFSVTHQEADMRIGNDSVAVATAASVAADSAGAADSAPPLGRDPSTHKDPP